MARYGAYPVVWILAGESDTGTKWGRGPWADVARYLRRIDPYHHPLTCHAATGRRGATGDEVLVDYDMVWGSHGGYDAIARPTLAILTEACAKTPAMPVLCGETAYEGHMQNHFPDVQRHVFWMYVLGGAAGHTYGAAGVWHAGVDGDPGITPIYDYTTWKEGMNYPGSTQIGLNKKLLQQYPWWRFGPHPEWVERDLLRSGNSRRGALRLPAEAQPLQLERDHGEEARRLDVSRLLVQSGQRQAIRSGNGGRRRRLEVAGRAFAPGLGAGAGTGQNAIKSGKQMATTYSQISPLSLWERVTVRAGESRSSRIQATAVPVPSPPAPLPKGEGTFSRRVLSLISQFVFAVGLAFCACAFAAQAAEPPPSGLALWYDRPAAEWLEALPVGNGRLGCMVFGGVGAERLQLNESSVWSGSPQDSDNPHALAALPEVRRLLLDGKYAEANALAVQKLICKGLGSNFANGANVPFGCFQTLGDLTLKFDAQGGVRDYRRGLDLDTAIATVSYRLGDATFTREVFSSAPSQVLVVRLTCDKPGKIGFTAGLTRPERFATAADGSDGLVISGQMDDGRGGATGMKYMARLKAIAEGGKVSTVGNSLRVEGANAVTLLLTAGTDYKLQPPAYRGNPHEKLTADQLATAAAKPYDELRTAQRGRLPEVLSPRRARPGRP